MTTFVNTLDEKNYRFYPIRGKLFSFRVCCPNNCHVALATQPREGLPMYEIVIGGWNNTKSVIRQIGKEPVLTEVSTHDILNAGELRPFSIRWHDNVISVLREDELVPFMSAVDPNLFPVKYVGISTAYGSTGSWLIHDPTFNIETVPNAIKGAFAGSEKVKFVKTPDEKRYKFYPAQDGVFTFNVCCANDCHVALSTQSREATPMYEIVFGGWINTKSVIRQIDLYFADIVAASTPGIVRDNEMRGFWIRWHDNVIYVGRAGDPVPFMSCKDRNLFPVNYVGVCTAFGASGSWLLDETPAIGGVPVPPKVREVDFTGRERLTSVNTPNEKKYIFYPGRGKVFLFKVRCSNDCHVALSTQPQQVLPMYEIVIGGWTNSKSVIRQMGKEPDLIEVSTPGIVNANEMRVFWVHWHDNVIYVGRGGEQIPFMSYKDPNLFPVRYVGICTAFGSTGSWSFDDTSPIDAVPVATIVKTPKEKSYKFYPVHGKKIFNFEVRCSNDCHVALSAQPLQGLPMYEIVIGGWNNSKSVIRKMENDPPEVVELSTPDILSVTELRGFWIRWYDNVISVGHVGEEKSFMSHNDPKLFDVIYVGISTGLGARGTWSFEGA